MTNNEKLLMALSDEYKTFLQLLNESQVEIKLCKSGAYAGAPQHSQYRNLLNKLGAMNYVEIAQEGRAKLYRWAPGGRAAYEQSRKLAPRQTSTGANTEYIARLIADAVAKLSQNGANTSAAPVAPPQSEARPVAPAPLISTVLMAPPVAPPAPTILLSDAPAPRPVNLIVN